MNDAGERRSSNLMLEEVRKHSCKGAREATSKMGARSGVFACSRVESELAEPKFVKRVYYYQP